MQLLCKTSYSQSLFPIQDEEDSFVIKAIIHAINDDNVPGLKHLLGSLTSYDINQPNKVRYKQRKQNIKGFLKKQQTE